MQVQLEKLSVLGDLDELENALGKINEKQEKETLKQIFFSSHPFCARSQFDFHVHLQPCYGN